MNARPLVAVVGRPNVGKSTLFNKLVGKRVSIVEDVEGVTRDRLYCDTDWCGKAFTLIDTGGLDVRSDDEMLSHIREQAKVAVDIADCILFVVDGRAGVTSNDREVASFLRRSGKPIVLAVNKLDNNEVDKTYDFYELGIGEPFAVSAVQGMGLGDLLDAVAEHLPECDGEGEDDVLDIAIVGKPNAGKSSLTNKILGYDRVIVSNIAGTTRDAIDTPFERDGVRYNLIDTAGIRKKSSVDRGVEQYSVLRALAAVRRADVVFVVIDSADGVTEQDVKICGYVHEQGKPSVIVMNKWDAVEKDTHTSAIMTKQLAAQLKFMDYFVAVYVSAMTGQRVEKLLAEARNVYEQASRRVTTSVLNDVVRDAILAVEPPSDNGRRLKVLYATQSDICPPTFVFFVNDEKLVHFSYRRYLENSLRKAFEFRGTPIRLVFRNRRDDFAE
ncbi:MAG TPA: ribosome biogenesis GTPase Der [Candidatus Ornithoclostridium faecigallinarum]|nr:ribosome biogenesis GTPase Der [Candidatus Ornithoclostridium faecigallinarum]